MKEHRSRDHGHHDPLENITNIVIPTLGINFPGAVFFLITEHITPEDLTVAADSCLEVEEGEVNESLLLRLSYALQALARAYTETAEDFNYQHTASKRPIVMHKLHEILATENI